MVCESLCDSRRIPRVLRAHLLQLRAFLAALESAIGSLVLTLISRKILIAKKSTSSEKEIPELGKEIE